MAVSAGGRRGLFFSLVLVTFFLSTFLTNDVSLLIAIPLTLELEDTFGRDIWKVIVFEAISANIGSMLTPIGNPQNLFLWHVWGVSFISFVVRLAPLVLILLLILALLSWPVFSGNIRTVPYISAGESSAKDKRLLIFSCAFLVLYVVALDMGVEYYVLPLIVIFYLVFRRNILLRTDWVLILMFILVFVDLHVVSTIPTVSKFVSLLLKGSKSRVFLASALISQIISNVPASILISKFTHRWFFVVCGVNVGGNGLVTASFANIIAVRMAREKDLWVKFHRYSIPYFIVSTAVLYFMLRSL